MSKVHRSMAREVHKPSKQVVKRVAASGGTARRRRKPQGEQAQERPSRSCRARDLCQDEGAARDGRGSGHRDEVLRGEIANSNAAFLSDRLFDAGYDVRAHRVVSDTPADIRAAIESLAGEVAVIVATGGLGRPTTTGQWTWSPNCLGGLNGARSLARRHETAILRPRFRAHPQQHAASAHSRGCNRFSERAGIAPGFCLRIGEAEAYFLPEFPARWRAFSSLSACRGWFSA